jgi:hypothetical protein
VSPTGSLWFLENREHKFSRCYVSPIPDAIEYLRENNIRPPGPLDLETVVKWVFSQPGLFGGYSNSPGSRAINYFTRLFVPQFREDELSDTVWALAGIESLLVEGGRSSQGQLREKLGALFGWSSNPAWLSKMTNCVYDFRSKLIHGNRQLRSAFRDAESEESQKRFDEEYDSERFAVGILLVLLQLLIASGRQSFSFRTILDDSK